MLTLPDATITWLTVKFHDVDIMYSITQIVHPIKYRHGFAALCSSEVASVSIMLINPFSLGCIIWGLCCQKQVSQAAISNYIPQLTVRCNYLSLPEIPASGNEVLICMALQFRCASNKTWPDPWYIDTVVSYLGYADISRYHNDLRGSAIPWRQHCVQYNSNNISHKISTWFPMLCSVVIVLDSIPMDLWDTFIHILKGCLTGTRTTVWLPQCKWSYPQIHGYIPELHHTETQWCVNQIHSQDVLQYTAEW